MNAEQIKTAETLQSLADNATKALELASFMGARCVKLEKELKEIRAKFENEKAFSDSCVFAIRNVYNDTANHACCESAESYKGRAKMFLLDIQHIHKQFGNFLLRMKGCKGF